MPLQEEAWKSNCLMIETTHIFWREWGASGSVLSTGWFSSLSFRVLVAPLILDRNWNFALAASRSGIPGLIQEDSADLYSAMRQALLYVEEHYGARIINTGLIGLSQGGLHAAYISKFDAEQKKIGIHTYLLLNPPVDLLQAIEKIDRLAQLGKKLGPKQSKRIHAYGAVVAGEAFEKPFDDPWSDSAYFADWEKRFRLTDAQIQYLIGRGLQAVIGDVIYVLELVHHVGLLKTPVSYGNRTDRLDEARSYSLKDYVNRFVIPRLNNKTGSKAGISALNSRLSLKPVEMTLVKNKNIYIMHNRDDFFVSGDDLDYLESLLGDRTKIYPMAATWGTSGTRRIGTIF